MAEAEAVVEEPVAEAPTEVMEAPAAAAAEQPKPAKKDKKDKGKKGKGAPDPSSDGPSVAGHPRAARSVERAKSWGALVGFLAGGYYSLPTHTLAEAGLRALVAGVVLYIAVWAGSVFFWRRMVMLEIRAREQQLLAAARAAHAQQAAAAGEAGSGAGR